MADDSILLTNIGQLLTMTGDGLGMVENVEVTIRDGRVASIAPHTNPPSPSPSPFKGEGMKGRGRRVIDCKGCVAMPGFVDPHTHLVFGGWRADEFEQRLLGRTYKEIAQAGGGILSTVKATRAASEDELYERARERLREMSAWGTTTAEVKSGYGLETETELKMLRVARRLGDAGLATVVPTFLGAHSVPAGSDRSDYVRQVIEEMMPKVAEAKLARFCDVFCESIAFNPEESARILEAGKRYGMLPTVHADEIESSGGAEVAARVGAVSASHLLQPSDEGLRQMAKKGVVAVLLPGTSFFLGAGHHPRPHPQIPQTTQIGSRGERNPQITQITQTGPEEESVKSAESADEKSGPSAVRKMRELGITMALATDFNPGSSTMLAQPLTLQLGCIYYGLTIVEALRGVTVNAAKALKLESEVGTIEPGKQADIVVTDVPDYRHLAYRLGHNPVRLVLRRGLAVAAPGSDPGYLA